MKDFFIAYSSVVASMIGIIFAFLISKALGFEENQSLLVDESNKLLFELQRIKNKIKINGINKGTYDAHLEEIAKECSENDFKNMESTILNYMNKNKCLYLSYNECLEFLEKEKEKEKEKKHNNFPLRALPRITLNQINYQREKLLNLTLDEFELEQNKIETHLKKINNLKLERNYIKFFLIGILIMLVIGVIYPLSFLKYNDNLFDYSMNNFFIELFSISGLMLVILFLFVFIFLIKIFKITKISKEVKIFKKLFNETISFSDDEFLLKNYFLNKKN